MGGSTYGAADWARTSSYTASISSARSAGDIFKAYSVHEDLDPSKFQYREARDSDGCPDSTPIILALDVTSSMGRIAQAIAQKGLATMIKEIMDRKPVTGPQVAFCAFADAFDHCGANMQFSQFEADSRQIDHLQKIYVAGGGGANSSESYTLPWHLAAYRTRTDCYEKRKQKGFLFTFGDDGVPPDLSLAQLSRVYGTNDLIVPTNAELFEEVSKMYNVYHLMIQESGTHSKRVENEWQDFIGERAILVSDHTKLAEIIVSIMQVVAGVNKADIVKSWGGGTGLVVQTAIKDLVVKGDQDAAVRF